MQMRCGAYGANADAAVLCGDDKNGKSGPVLLLLLPPMLLLLPVAAASWRCGVRSGVKFTPGRRRIYFQTSAAGPGVAAAAAAAAASLGASVALLFGSCLASPQEKKEARTRQQDLQPTLQRMQRRRGTGPDRIATGSAPDRVLLFLSCERATAVAPAAATGWGALFAFRTPIHIHKTDCGMPPPSPAATVASALAGNSIIRRCVSLVRQMPGRKLTLQRSGSVYGRMRSARHPEWR